MTIRPLPALFTGLAVAGNTVFGLLAAALWGGGDFAGSMAVKRLNGTIRGSLMVVVLGHALSLLCLAACALAFHDVVPHGTPIVWSVCGGAISGVALVFFYLALASGHMGSAAAVSGLICAALPAIVSAHTEGAPGWRRLLGFALAGGAIWLIASAGGGASRKAMLLSVSGGVGFGIYFVALKQGGTVGLLWPAAAARVGSLCMCSLLLLIFTMVEWRRPPRPENVTPAISRLALAWIVGGAALDTGGNLFFMLATQVGRLDVAAVLASIYPAGTILLAAAVLHERTSRQQKLGMWLALPAVILITL